MSVNKFQDHLQVLPEDDANRQLPLLIDFDGTQVETRTRLYHAHKAALPATVAERIYLLGSLDEPEKLQAACQRQRLEQLGLELSVDCAPAPASNLWQHPHLQHNATELARLVAQVRPFLFWR
ncbi:hypothetical protein [Sphaerotilus sp.]|jgi:hypothetical protein|uniref:hypothetical protein n=1 Tax=Sphaerotilus sp. TaxID=2093942 RepID=UPI0025F7BE03|nr:hypothetical protein [Sphaerotilus sp.]